LSDRSGCSLIELTVLGVLDGKLAGRPRAHVQSAKVLDGLEESIGCMPTGHCLTWPARGLFRFLSWRWRVMSGTEAERHPPTRSTPDAVRRVLVGLCSSPRLTSWHRCRPG
jgi:hypothetical protein